MKVVYNVVYSVVAVFVALSMWIVGSVAILAILMPDQRGEMSHLVLLYCI